MTLWRGLGVGVLLYLGGVLLVVSAASTTFAP
jgi:hypothetical protein